MWHVSSSLETTLELPRTAKWWWTYITSDAHACFPRCCAGPRPELLPKPLPLPTVSSKQINCYHAPKRKDVETCGFWAFWNSTDKASSSPDFMSLALIRWVSMTNLLLLLLSQMMGSPCRWWLLGSPFRSSSGTRWRTRSTGVLPDDMVSPCALISWCACPSLLSSMRWCLSALLHCHAIEFVG